MHAMPRGCGNMKLRETLQWLSFRSRPPYEPLVLVYAASRLRIVHCTKCEQSDSKMGWRSGSGVDGENVRIRAPIFADARACRKHQRFDDDSDRPRGVENGANINVVEVFQFE